MSVLQQRSACTTVGRLHSVLFCTVSKKTRQPTHVDNFAKIDRFSRFFHW